MTLPNDRQSYQRLFWLCAVFVFITLVSQVLLFNSDAYKSGWTKFNQKKAQPQVIKPRVGFVTQFYSDNYLQGVLTLGHSLWTHHPDVPFNVMYLPVKVSNESLQVLKSLGYILHPIQRIKPAKEPVHTPFADQFSKLLIWNFTQYDRLVYLDADCLAVGELSGLLHMPKSIPFAATGDIWDLDTCDGGYSDLFNAGVISIVPDSAQLETFLNLIPRTDLYDSNMVEQALLNYYYRHNYARMSYIFNMNLAMFNAQHSDLAQTWNKLWPSARVIHFTTQKPFLSTKEDYVNDKWNEYHHAALKRLESLNVVQ